MERKMTVPIAKARELLGDQALAHVRSWDAVTIKAVMNPNGSWSVSVSEPEGIMVALMVPEHLQAAIAVPGGEPPSDLHVTLCYLGNVDDMSLEDQRRLIGVTGEVIRASACLDGVLTGTGRFINGEDTDAYWVGVEVPGLLEFQGRLATALGDAGFPVRDDFGGYTPHVTVAYIPKDQPTPPLSYAPQRVCFEHVTVCIGATRLAMALQREDEAYPPVGMPSGWTPEAVNKAIEVEEEDRFTLAPWYIPDRLDAHGEWTDKKELERTFHSYLAKADRGIRLQHNTDVVAGEWASGVVWPFRVTLPLTKADGTVTEHTFPAGTPFLGVHWNEEAWKLIKEGKIRGYSIGGTSERMLVDLEGYDA